MKIQVFDSVAVITSSVKYDELKFVQKYAPQSMTLWKDEKKTDPLFHVTAKNGADGDISDAGAIFGKGNNDGFAQISMIVKPGEGVDVKEFLADQIGKGVAGLKAFEEAFPAIYTALKDERDGVLASIEVLA